MRTLLSCLLAAALATPAAAQLTLSQVVEQAAEQYPAVQASRERANAALAGIRLSRTSYLPRADFFSQINRATHNNVFGMLLQQGVISSISGPVLPLTANSVWGSATGSLVTWEPFDFGLRRANVDIAARAADKTKAEVSVTRLEVGAAAADAFLTLLAAQQTVEAAKASVERARVLDRTITALVTSELRPGAEASRAKAELATAETQLIRAEQAVADARAGLSPLLGVEPASITVAPGKLLGEPPTAEAPSPDVGRHPLAAVQTAVVEEAKARERALERSYFPRFQVAGTGYGRGTGADVPGVGGRTAGRGILPSTGNWGVGLSVFFPAFEIASLRARRQIETANERAETARQRQIVQDLRGQADRARAALDGARRVARAIPAQAAAARATVEQTTARYRAGLGTVVEVADAQRLLTQAEIDESLAKLAIWRAVLGLAAAEGDLTAFLEAAR